MAGYMDPYVAVIEIWEDSCTNVASEMVITPIGLISEGRPPRILDS